MNRRFESKDKKSYFRPFKKQINLRYSLMKPQFLNGKF